MKKNRQLNGRFFLIGALVLGLFVVAPGMAAVNLPSFTLPTVRSGSLVSSNTYEGQAMLITFFATWCGPCMQEIPALKAVQSQYQAQGFSVVALAVDEGGAGTVAKLVEKAGINYQVLLADEGTRHQFGGVATIPTSFLVNKQGHVVKKYAGLVPRSLLERDIESVL
ncbi:MAG: TlpA disulfide reductase family protein [Desulfobulbus sp.]|nr:TlpA disulfide reductase family protein [Desulfobulbus sp.]